MSVKGFAILLIALLLLTAPASAIIKSCEDIWMCSMNQTPNMTAGPSQDLNDYYRNDTSKSLFGAFLRRNVNDEYLSLIGGTGSPPYSGNLQLYGGDNPAQSGGFIMSVGNDSGTAPAVVFSALGGTDNPELSLSGNKIVSLKDPTNPQDAATKNYVDTSSGSANVSHNLLLNLTTSDDHPQYAYLPGRSGGQTLTGGTTTGNLVLNGSANNGNIILNPKGGWVSVATNISTAFLTISDGLSSVFPQFVVGVNTQDATKNLAGFSVTPYRANGFLYIELKTELGKKVYVRTAEGLNASGATGVMFTFLPASGYIGLSNVAPTAQVDMNGDLRVRSCSGTPTFDAGGNMTCASDEKLKTAVTPYVSDTSKLDDVATYKYKWSAASGFDTNRINAGFSANELQVAYPECVIARDDMTYKQICDKGKDCQQIETKIGTQTLSLDDKCLIAVLWNAVIEQQKDIKDLKEWKQDKVRV